MIKLIPYHASFLESYLEWRCQPSSVRHNPFKPMRREEIARMLGSEGSSLSDLEKFDSYRWFIEWEGVVGSVSLKNIRHMMNYGEVGYGLGEAYHRRGIATAAVGMFIGMVFEQSPLRKLLAYVHDKNMASCRVLQKPGFVQEGFLREHYIINGVPENGLLFGLLQHEWKAKQRLR